ncbi:MAG: AraC family transcriptional regulator [Candidatus Promineifilaceae bacterium]|jgi:AraC family transcriptional regulator
MDSLIQKRNIPPQTPSIFAETASLALSHLSIGRAHYPPGGTFGPRLMKYWSLITVLKGHIKFNIDGQVFNAGPHTVFLSHPNGREFYECARSGVTEHTWVRFQLNGLPVELFDHLIHLPRPITLSEEIHARTLEVLRMTGGDQIRHTEQAQAMSLLLFWRYVAEAERVQRGKQVTPAVLAVNLAQEYIHDHIFDTLTVSEIASGAAISPSQLTRLFRAKLSLTPMAYVWKVRTQRGIEMLQNTGLSIGLIAHQCGFKSQAHFTRRIKKQTGIAPGEIRERADQLVSRATNNRQSMS